MNALAVRLKYKSVAQRPVAGWLVRSASTAEWLSVATLCRNDQETVRFLPLDDALDPAHPAVAMILSPELTELPAPFGCQAYGFAAERLLIPVDAVLDPPITPEEFHDWLPNEETMFVWHPTEGLVRF